jgi:hypothetical protein
MRLFLLALILANCLYFGWSQHLLEGLGFAPASQSEPRRLAQQIEPDAIRILGPSELRTLEEKASADAAPKECLQAGPLDETRSNALRPVLESALPPGSWALDASLQPARWLVYMGKFANADALAKKQAEIAAMNLKVEGVPNAALEPGLSLGGFDTKTEAEAQLAKLGQRGIRTARVLQVREEGVVYQLKLPAVSDAMLARLPEVRAALGGVALRNCN